MGTIHEKAPVIISSTRSIGSACPSRCQLCRHLNVGSILTVPLRPQRVTLVTIHGPRQCARRADVLGLLTCILLTTCGSGQVTSDLDVTFSPRGVGDDRSIFVDLFKRLGVRASRNILPRSSLGSPGVDHLLAFVLLSGGGTLSSLRVMRRV